MPKKKKPKSTREAMHYTARRVTVAEMYLQGSSQSEIALNVGVDQSTISRDLQAIRQSWVEAAVVDFHQARAQELARIDAMEKEYWVQYEASKAPSRKTIVRGRGRAADGQPDQLDQTQVTETRTGDPRYLQGIQWCIEQRIKILGLYSPTRLDITWREKFDAQQREIAERFFTQQVQLLADKLRNQKVIEGQTGGAKE